MSHRLRRAQLWTSWLMFAFTGSLLWTVQSRAQDFERRVASLEAVQADVRLGKIETRLDSIDYVGKGILVLVGGQFLLQGLNLRTRKT